MNAFVRRMNRYWTKHMNKVRRGEKSRVVAQRDFRRKFGYMSGDFRAEAYYAESVDLIRKLMMSGLLSLIRPGTVFQSFCSVLISLTFVTVHIKIWPVRRPSVDACALSLILASVRWQYPSVASNLLKMYVDVELFLVTLVLTVINLMLISGTRLEKKV